MGVFATLWLGLSRPAAADPLDEVVDALAAGPAPASDGALTNGIHYFVSNERRLDLFAEDIRDRGGVLVGVGTDQNYILAAWARPELLVIIDRDPAVIDLHRIYAAFFRHADTPAEFEALWTERGRTTALALLAPTPELIATYETARTVVARRFASIHRRYAELGVTWLLTDPEAYRFVADLVARDRVVARIGDYRTTGTLDEMGRLLRIHGADVEVLYLSNIEQYFMYGPAFRANVRGLPWSDRAVVLRTLPARPAGFEYIVQSAAALRTALADPKIRSVYALRGLAKGQHLCAARRVVLDGTELTPSSSDPCTR